MTNRELAERLGELTESVQALSNSTLAVSLCMAAIQAVQNRLIVVLDMLAEKAGLTQEEVDAELERLAGGTRDDGNAGGIYPDSRN